MVARGTKLKRPSVASSKSKPPDSPTLFLDRSLGRNVIAAALRQAGATVEIHDDHFPIDAKDEQWISVVGRKGWVVLTKDRRIRYRRHEQVAVKKAMACIFTLTAGDLQGEEMARIFVDALPKMIRFVAKHNPPFIATVAKSGAISKIM
ncbi:MAG: hypothetical protein A2Z34_04185 [Planctomycetes bacterium RBG_16_59_8]|nr:MAG: hypothetical protein A2Z34_04185 [Planctomycetes bacterium RBG_16_59_8]